MIFYFLTSIVTGLYSAGVAKEKKRNPLKGFVLGFLLNLLGIFIETLLSVERENKRREMPNVL